MQTCAWGLAQQAALPWAELLTRPVSKQVCCPFHSTLSQRSSPSEHVFARRADVRVGPCTGCTALRCAFVCTGPDCAALGRAAFSYAACAWASMLHSMMTSLYTSTWRRQGSPAEHARAACRRACGALHDRLSCLRLRWPRLRCPGLCCLQLCSPCLGQPAERDVLLAAPAHGAGRAHLLSMLARRADVRVGPCTTG